MTIPPNTQPDAAQIVREMRDQMAWSAEHQPIHNGWQISRAELKVLLDAFDAQTKEIAELREALSAESEACAKIAGDGAAWFAHYPSSGPVPVDGDGAGKTIAAAIRARSALRTKENPNG